MVKTTSTFVPARRASQRSAARDPLAFLQTDDKLAGLLPTAHQIARLQSDCERILPGLLSQCRVMHLREGSLHIAVPNAALATRLKQGLSKLEAGLREKGWSVDAVKLKMQPPTSLPHQGGSQMSAPHLSAQALGSFAELEQALDTGPENDALRAALQALLSRRERS